MRLASAIPFAILLVVAGCGGGDPETSSSSGSDSTAGGEGTAQEEQTFPEAMEIICNAWVGVEEIDNAPPEEQLDVLMVWILDRLTNQRANELYETLLGVPPYERRELVDHFAGEVGLEECAILPLWPLP